MEERVILSGDNALRELCPNNPSASRRIELSGSGALAVSGKELFVASDWGDVIWRLDSRALIPTGLFAGGPGVSRMMLSRDGKRLYVLCSDADSILMLSARTGTPLMINRAGVAPGAMALDETGKSLVVAGGASGEVLVYDAATLRMTQRLQTAGIVFSVLEAAGCIYALSLDETMNTVLTEFFAGEKRSSTLPGMPGTLFWPGRHVVAATHEGLYIIGEALRASRRCKAPGRAAKLMAGKSGLWMIDMWGENLLHAEDTGWHTAAERVKDALILP